MSLAARRGDMDSEERRHAHGGTDRAGGTTERPSGSRAEDSLTIGELARDLGVTLRALRFYQTKGLLAPRHNGSARQFSSEDRDRLALILQGKRLGFTLTEIREMLSARDRGCVKIFRLAAENVSSRSICWSAKGATSMRRWPNCGKSILRCLSHRIYRLHAKLRCRERPDCKAQFFAFPGL